MIHLKKILCAVPMALSSAGLEVLVPVVEFARRHNKQSIELETQPSLWLFWVSEALKPTD